MIGASGSQGTRLLNEISKSFLTYKLLQLTLFLVIKHSTSRNRGHYHGISWNCGGSGRARGLSIGGSDRTRKAIGQQSRSGAQCPYLMEKCETVFKQSAIFSKNLRKPKKNAWRCKLRGWSSWIKPAKVYLYLCLRRNRLQWTLLMFPTKSNCKSILYC